MNLDDPADLAGYLARHERQLDELLGPDLYPLGPDALDVPDPLAVCDCYDPVSLEYGPNYPCPRCQWLEAKRAAGTTERNT